MSRLQIHPLSEDLVLVECDYGSLRLEDPLLKPILLPFQLERAVRKRKLDFLVGRLCAQTGVGHLDQTLGSLPIRIGEKRQPMWPEGFIGSISHSQGRACAIVARNSSYSLVGCDIEHHIDSNLDGICKHVCTQKEWDNAQQELKSFSKTELLTLIFSAKETLYKALFPKVRVYFGFHKASVQTVSRENIKLKINTDLGPFKKNQSFTIKVEMRTNSVVFTHLVV